HTENQPRLVVQLDGRAEDFAVSAEAPLPQSVTQHGEAAAVWAIFRRIESTSGNDGRAEQREVFAGDMHAAHLLGMIASGKVHSGSGPIVRGHLPEDRGLLFPDAELG